MTNDELTDAERAEVEANHQRDMALLDELRAGIARLIDDFHRKPMPTWVINRPAEFSFGLVSPWPYTQCLWLVSGAKPQSFFSGRVNFVLRTPLSSASAIAWQAS